MASRELKVNIVGDSKDLERALGRSATATSKMGGALKTLGKVAAVGVGAAFAGMAVIVKQGFDELAEGEKVMAQTQARLKSTGSAAKVTAKDVTDLATAQSKLTGIDDEAVQAGENMLLTFTNIHNELGKGNDVFNQATVAVEDMATAMNDGAIPSGEQLSTTAIRIGKALNDPIKGMTALGRVGVQFTASQKDAIEALVKSGDRMGAQKLILAELTKEFGGSAKAAGETFPGQLAKLRNAFDDASSKIAVVFLPVLTKVMTFITDKLIPGMSKAADFIAGFWKEISKQFAKAPTFSAKVKVVFSGVATLAKQFVDALFSQIEQFFPQRPLIIQPQTKVAIGGGGVDWQKTADDMMTALALALQSSVVLVKALGSAITDALRKVNWEQVGASAGPGLVTALLAAFQAVLSPSFWIRNWELALGVAINALILIFPEVFGPAKLAGIFSGAFTRALARFSPELSAAFGRLIADVGPIAARALGRVGDDLFRLTTVIFGRLTKVAVFVVKVLGVAATITAIEDFARAVGRKIQDVIDWFRRLPAAITAAVGNLGSLLYNAGASIIQGLWDGAKSKVAGFLSWLHDLTKLIPLHKGPPGQDAMLLDGVGRLIMQGLENGMKVGWGRIEKLLDGLNPELQKRAGNMVDAMKQAIMDKQSAFASAFDGLVQAALAAFDKISQEFETKTEKKIREQDERRAAADRKRALTEAQAQLEAAQAAVASMPTVQPGQIFTGDPAAAQKALEDVKTAQQAVADAQFAIQRAQDERTAANERAQYEAKRERQRLNLEHALDKLKENYANQLITTQQFHDNLVALFKKFEVPLGKAAGKLGAALQDGLLGAFGDVRAAARALANEVLDAFKDIKIIIHAEIHGTAPEHRQSGGPVKAGGIYVIGEKGPEIFIPSTSGRIVANGTGSMSPAGGFALTLNFNGPTVGSSREFEDTVRRALYDVQRRNPGTGL